MTKRIRWMVYGVVFFGLVVVYVMADFRQGPLAPDAAVIELAKAKGYIEAAVSKRPPVVLVEGAEPVVYMRFAGEFVEPEPPAVELGWRFGETALGGECPSFQVEKQEVPRTSPPWPPNWKLRPGDLRGECACNMVRTGDVVLGKVEQYVEAQTPHGLVGRDLEPQEEQLELWASKDVLPGRWQVLFDLDVLAPLTSERPVLAFVGASWFKPQRRIGWRIMGGRSFGGGVDDRVTLEFGDDESIDIPFTTSEDGWYVGGGIVARFGKK